MVLRLAKRKGTAFPHSERRSREWSAIAQVLIWISLVYDRRLQAVDRRSTLQCMLCIAALVLRPDVASQTKAANLKSEVRATLPSEIRRGLLLDFLALVVVDDVSNVGESFAIGRNAAILLDPQWAGVVGCQRLHGIAAILIE